MNFSKYIPDFETEFEKEYGRKPGLIVHRLADYLSNISEKFERMGREDAIQGKSAQGKEAFTAWGRKVFPDNFELGDTVGELMQTCYMDSYEEATQQMEGAG